MVVGWIIAVCELSIYFLISYTVRNEYLKLLNMNCIEYYWLTMTILTMIWEISFVYNYESINILSNNLIQTKTHVWTNDYDLSYILPWKLAYIFYAEYGAYADREYMIDTDNWSRVIESSHALLCGLFATMVLYQKLQNSTNKYYLTIGISMGSQLMNSILYMASYFVQLRESCNINYCSNEFPCGVALLSRPFMYVNIFWLIMPSYIILNSLN